MRVKRLLNYFLYPFAFTLAYILVYNFLLYLADLPGDYCYFHSHEPTKLQELFLDNMGHIEPHGLGFMANCLLLFTTGIFFAGRKDHLHKKRIFREAEMADIPEIQIVRNAVTENTLSDPALVSDKDCGEFMFRRGKGWVCETQGRIVGFAIADLRENNIWALFVHPDMEGKGIGKKLHQVMLDWYFAQGRESVWLGTAPNTRAERFYRAMGWKETGTHGKGEIKFEMKLMDWKKTER